MTSENLENLGVTTDAPTSPQPTAQEKPKGYKAAIVCIVVAAAALAIEFGYSAIYALLNASASFNLLSVAVNLLVPAAVLLIDFLAMRECKWWNWTIASLGIKSWGLLMTVPSLVYTIGKMLTYPTYYYSNLISYLCTVIFLLLTMYPSIYNVRRLRRRRKSEGIVSTSPFDALSILGISIGFVAAAFFLIGGLASINASGFAKLGVIFIMPALSSLIFITMDLLALKDTKWMAWTIASLAVKGYVAILIVYCLASEIWKAFMGYHSSNISFYIILLVLVAALIYPSVRNIVNISRRKRLARADGVKRQHPWTATQCETNVTFDSGEQPSVPSNPNTGDASAATTVVPVGNEMKQQQKKHSPVMDIVAKIIIGAGILAWLHVLIYGFVASLVDPGYIMWNILIMTAIVAILVTVFDYFSLKKRRWRVGSVVSIIFKFCCLLPLFRLLIQELYVGVGGMALILVMIAAIVATMVPPAYNIGRN